LGNQKSEIQLVFVFELWQRILCSAPAGGVQMIILAIIGAVVYIPLAVIFGLARKYK
jgi:hypothetical protein